MIQAPEAHTNASETVSYDPNLQSRLAAYSVLQQVLIKKQALDHVLQSDDEFSILSTRDKAFCRMLVATCLRRLGQIDDIIAKAEDNPGRTTAQLQLILRIGAAQILFMAVADHAAVDTCVTLAQHLGMERQKSFVNAVLRTITRSGKDWLERQDEARLNTPEWLLKLWIADYGLRPAVEIAAANLTEAPLDISIRDEKDRNYWGSTFQASEVGRGTLRRTAGGSVTELEGFDDGKWWVQDVAAALPAHLFGDLNGRHVVDLCAAPGGKTMQLAAMGARVTALDRSAKRLAILKSNLQRVQLEEQVEMIAADAASWRPKEGVDFILLDAPCSATGTVRRHPDVLHLKSERDIDRLADVQARILDNALDILNPGGILVYCTCSLQKSEGEHQVQRVLSRYSNVSKIAIQAEEIGGVEDAITDDGDVRLLPYHLAAHSGADGFFISRLTKQ